MCPTKSGCRQGPRYSVAEFESWDQNKTLCPPPYKHALKGIAERGMYLGDKQFDDLPTSMVACSKIMSTSTNTLAQLPHRPEPDWVDWARVANGQTLWAARLSSTLNALGISLLLGFSIARFSEVLNGSGYSSGVDLAANRYASTLFSIMDWIHHPLDEPTSKSRQSITRVRAAHSFARRHSVKAFAKETFNAGVPLSQFDMAEVLLAFGCITLYVIESEMVGDVIKDEDREDMVHMWRLIGYHLGIEDEFNVCQSVEFMQACHDDFAAWTPRRLETSRESASKLRDVCFTALGNISGIGRNFWTTQFGITIELVQAQQVTMGYLTSNALSSTRSNAMVEQRESFTSILIRRFNRRLLPGSPLNTVVSRAARAKRTLHDSCSPQTWQHVLRLYTLLARVADSITNSLSVMERIANHSFMAFGAMSTTSRQTMYAAMLICEVHMLWYFMRAVYPSSVTRMSLPAAVHKFAHKFTVKVARRFKNRTYASNALATSKIAVVA